MMYEVEDNGAHTIKESIASVALCAGDGPVGLCQEVNEVKQTWK
jgi:hypothetical protein